MGNVLDEVQELLDGLRRQSVVSIGRVRRVRALLRQANDPHPARRLLASLGAEALGLVGEQERHLLHRVERICEERDDLPLVDLARCVAADYEFRRRNRDLRSLRILLLRDDFPEVAVQEHRRRGRTVRAHWRLVGNHHLSEIQAVPGSRAGQVLRLIADGRHGA